jgi:hypothetical protein
MWTTLGGPVTAQPLSLHAESDLPSARDFLTSAGFGGAAALLAAIFLAAALLVIARNIRNHHAQHLDELEHHHAAIRDDQQRTAALDRAWRRLQWVVDTAGLEPASSQGVTLGLGPELATEVLRGILREADELGDEALGNAVTVHLSQFSLVLAQQSGHLTHPAAATSKVGGTAKTADTSAADSNATNAPKTDKPDPSATTPTEDSSSSTAPAARARRRS